MDSRSFSYLAQPFFLSKDPDLLASSPPLRRVWPQKTVAPGLGMSAADQTSNSRPPTFPKARARPADADDSEICPTYQDPDLLDVERSAFRTTVRSCRPTSEAKRSEESRRQDGCVARSATPAGKRGFAAVSSS